MPCIDTLSQTCFPQTDPIKLSLRRLFWMANKQVWLYIHHVCKFRGNPLWLRNMYRDTDLISLCLTFVVFAPGSRFSWNYTVSEVSVQWSALLTRCICGCVGLHTWEIFIPRGAHVQKQWKVLANYTSLKQEGQRENRERATPPGRSRINVSKGISWAKGENIHLTFWGLPYNFVQYQTRYWLLRRQLDQVSEWLSFIHAHKHQIRFLRLPVGCSKMFCGIYHYHWKILIV